MNRTAPVSLAVQVSVNDSAYYPVLMSSGAFAYCSSLKHHGDSFRPFLLGLMICEVRPPMTGIGLVARGCVQHTECRPSPSVPLALW